MDARPKSKPEFIFRIDLPMIDLPMIDLTIIDLTIIDLQFFSNQKRKKVQ